MKKSLINGFLRGVCGGGGGGDASDGLGIVCESDGVLVCVRTQICCWVVVKKK